MPGLEYYCSPVRPGFPISQWGGSVTAFGTLGCFVVARSDSRKVYILGNHHVLQYYQDDSWFDVDTKGMNTITCPHIGEIVQQASDRIGAFGDAMELANYKTGGKLQPMLSYYRKRQGSYSKGSAMKAADYASIAEFAAGILDYRGDAAIAQLFRGVSWKNVTPSGDKIKPPLSTSPATVGTRVWKWGYMSDKKKYGVIKAVVENETTFTSIKDTMFPDMNPKPRFSKKKVKFPKVYEIRGEAKGEVFQPQGDSGSILCRADTNEVVGLMSFKGDDRTAFAFPIHPILDYFGVDIAPHAGGTTYAGTRDKVRFLPLL